MNQHRPSLAVRRRWQFRLGWAFALLSYLVAPSLAADPKTSGPPPQELAARISDWIGHLGDTDYFVREDAQERLSQLGVDALDALTLAQNHEDLEVAKRARYLLRKLKVEWSRSDDPPEIRAQMANYELQNENARRGRIDQLRQLPGGMGGVALCRIVRFEPSLILSKEAAIAIIKQRAPGGTTGQKRAEGMTAALGNSLRSGANWVRLYLQAQTDVPGVLQPLSWEAERELAVLQSDPASSNRALVLELLRYEAGLLHQVTRLPESRAVRMKMIALEPLDGPTLAELVAELVAERDWVALEDLTKRFHDRVQQQAPVLYLLAEAQLQRGDKAAADALVAQARTLDPSDRSKHFQRAYQLGQRELVEWSEAEFRVLRNLGPGAGSLDLAVETDTPRVRELLFDYSQLPDADRVARIEAMSKLPAEEMLSALCRVVRFDPSDLRAKQAAVPILAQTYVDELAWKMRADVIRKTIGRQDRTAVRWLQQYIASRDKPEEAYAAFTKLADDEMLLLEHEPNDTTPDVVLALLQRQYALLRILARTDEAQVVLGRMVQLVQEKDEYFPELVFLLLRSEQWKLLDQIAEKYPDVFKTNNLLLYAHARAKLGLGQNDVSSQLATKALAFNPQNKAEHWRTAFELVRRGLNSYAEKEYQYLIDLGPPPDPYTLNAKFRLSELWHERGDHEPAAKLLEQAQATVQRDPENLARFVGDDPTWLPTRVHFVWAEHFAAQGDRVKQRESLLRAVEVGPFDADVLIALYRLPNQTAEQKAETLKLVTAAVDKYRDRMMAEPEDSVHYNQLAWLISNTEGDQDEALQASLKSLELRPGTAGYLDTLGRCYFARKELPNAVKYQTMAVEIDPYSLSLARQLKLFREANGQ